MSAPAEPKKDSSKDSQTSSVSDLSKTNVKVDEKKVSTDDLVDEEPTPFRWTDYLMGRKTGPRDLDAIATRRSIFEDPVLGPLYMPPPEYENTHRFDPDARWTYREEAVRRSLHYSWLLLLTRRSWLQALVRKLDWRVMLWGVFAFPWLGSRLIYLPCSWNRILCP